MKFVNLLTLILIIIGGMNWGLVGLFGYDVVASMSDGGLSALARTIYVLIGAAALWQLMPLARAAGSDPLYAEERAERGL